MTADVIHAENEFQPMPKDHEALEVAAFDGLLVAREVRDRVMQIEAGETDWQQAVMKRFDRVDSELRRMAANLELIVEHVKRRTIVDNETAQLRSIDAGQHK